MKIFDGETTALEYKSMLKHLLDDDDAEREAEKLADVVD